MPSRTKRVTILAISKLLNFAVQFLTPIFLVRILDRELYGQYKEFFVYASLIGSFISFSIKYNLLYFIPKYSKGLKYFITHTILLEFISCFIGVIIVYLFQTNIIESSSYNFFFLLIAYLILINNFDFLEPYWLSKKKSKYVLYYSFIFAVLRVIFVVGTAYITKDVITILYTVLFFEFARLLFGIIFSLYKKLLVFHLDYTLLKEQLVYIIPLGLAGLLVSFNSEVSKFVISTSLGPSALALYAIGSQRLPLVGIIRSSIIDVVFPDMSESVKEKPMEALNLWKRANVLYLFLLVPLFFLQIYYAETIITILFTSDYLGSVIIFQIYLIFFLLQCFEMGAPIRAMNKNKYLLIGHIFYTIIHIGVLYLSYQYFGIIGPAIAFVFMELISRFYFGFLIIKFYKIEPYQLFYWRKVIIIITVGLVSYPLMLLGGIFDFSDVVSVVLFGGLYMVIYLMIIHKFHFEETDALLARIPKLLKWRNK